MYVKSIELSSFITCPNHPRPTSLKYCILYRGNSPYPFSKGDRKDKQLVDYYHCRAHSCNKLTHVSTRSLPWDDMCCLFGGEVLEVVQNSLPSLHDSETAKVVGRGWLLQGWSTESLPTESSYEILQTLWVFCSTHTEWDWGWHTQSHRLLLSTFQTQNLFRSHFENLDLNVWNIILKCWPFKESCCNSIYQEKEIQRVLQRHVRKRRSINSRVDRYSVINSCEFPFLQ